MHEFLNVAKNLEVKEISKDVEFDQENQSFVAPSIPDNENEPDASNNESEQLINPNTDKDDDSHYNRQISDSFQLERNEEGMFVCGQCESRFTNKGNLKQHIKSIHE